MSKKTGKKRSKKYTGVNAKMRDDVVRVHKVEAVARSDRAQWLHDHHTAVRNGIIAIVVILIIVAGFVTIF